MATAPKGPHRVRRPFDAGGVRVAPGEIVDVTEWRNAFQLVDRGYLVALDPSELEAIETPPVKIAPAPAKKTPAKKAPAKKAAPKKVSSEIPDEGL